MSRRLSRLRRVVVVVWIIARHLAGYGVAVVRCRLGLGRVDAIGTARRVRRAIEDLGVAAIKIGQILSTRGDLLVPAYRTELAKLQDAAPPEPFATMMATLTTELGRPIEAVFTQFDPRPVAAASIGQAHAATLPDGSAVIVKIRRPGVVEQVNADLDILDFIVTQLSRVSPGARRYDLEGLSHEFAATLRSELDYRREAANIQRFTVNFWDDPTIHIPRVYPEWSTSRILTLERLTGHRIDDVAGLDAAGIDRRRLAENATRLMLRMIFEHGFFHADPHPGNFFIEPDGRIGLIDYGMVGTVDPPTRVALRALLLTLTTHDTTALVNAFASLGVTDVDEQRELAAEFSTIAETHLAGRLGDLALGPLLHDVLNVARRHRLHSPANLALLAKTLAMCEGIAAHLDPTFQMPLAVAPYLPHLLS